MLPTNEQGNQEKSLPAIAEPSLKFQFPEMEELDLFVVELEDGTKVVRTMDELVEAGLWLGSEEVGEG